MRRLPEGAMSVVGGSDGGDGDGALAPLAGGWAARLPDTAGNSASDGAPRIDPLLAARAAKTQTQYRHLSFFVGMDMRSPVRRRVADYVPISIALVPHRPVAD